ncbi:MAG: prolyl oligopeptidase family serine peptidase [Pseudomonadota bacterium]|nr:prolyl oligopeptidase family serine peptidase [Pseudomonadota bacterium]
MRFVLPAVLTLLLAACGGGTGTTTGGSATGVVNPPPTPAPARGSLAGSPSLAAPKLEPAVLAALLETSQPGTTKITGEPQCAITTFTVRYNTVGGAGEATDASAAIMLPSGGGASCSGSRPVLLYAHATAVEKSFDMANLQVNSEARLVAAMFAAQGFIVVAPNYAGYARSSLDYHPYLNAEQQGADMIDALRAARSSFTAIGAKDSGKLLITGYSQGGHVALATQRAMQALASAEFAPAAVSGMSGPYALTQFGDTQFAGSPRIGVTAFLPMLINAGQRSGAGLYGATSEIYEAPYAGAIASLLPAGATLGELVSSGQLPATALFAADSQPQASGYGQYFGSGNLIKTSYRSAYLADLQAHPCERSAAAPLDCAPAHPLRKWFLKNDLRNYLPSSPLMLCGGSGDPTVPYLNSVSLGAYLHANPRAGELVEIDLDDTPGLADPYRTQKLSFIAAKVALRLNALNNGDSPDRAVESNYHAGLVAPFCIAATRDFFQAVLKR